MWEQKEPGPDKSQGRAPCGLLPAERLSLVVIVVFVGRVAVPQARNVHRLG